MTVRNYILIIGFLVFRGILFPCIAESQSPDLYFKHLTPDDGLTQGVITDIYTDTKGFVWMTGLDGINRFDGTRCLANEGIAPGLENPGKTRKILEDKNGNIWFGYNEGVIQFSYRHNRFTTFKIPPQLVSRHNGNKSELFYPVAADQENYLLIGGLDKILLLYNTLTAAFQLYDQPVDQSTELTFYFPPGLSSLKQGWKWILNNNDSIFVCTLTGMQSGKPQWNRSGFSWTGVLLKSVWMPVDNTLFFYTNGRVCKYLFSSGQLVYSPEVKINEIYISYTQDAKGDLWISGTNNGLQVLDTATMQLVSQISYVNPKNNGLSSNNVTAYIDRNQMLWITAWGRGVDYASLDEERFTSFLASDDSRTYGYSNFIRGMTESPGGGFYCSTQSGIIMLDEDLRFIRILPGSLPEVQYPDILRHFDKMYYVSDMIRAPGLYQYDQQDGHTKNLTAGANFRAYQLGKMNDDNLLVATMNGLWKLEVGKQKIGALPGHSSLSDRDEVVVYGYADSDQQIYKCINNLGFVVYRETGDGYTEAFRFDEKITVKHIIANNDSLLWIGSSGGLYLFNARQLKMVKHFTTGQGLPDNVVYAVMPDEKNNLWLSTNKGLSYFDIPANRFINFTQEDGLQANEFNAHAVLKAGDGRIIFGGVNGLSVVNPRILTAKMASPVLQITALKSDSICNPYTYNEAGAVFTLAAGTNSFEIELTAISFRNPALCRIKYRLRDHDNDWLSTSNPGTIHYSKLPPGRYILEAMASNARGEFGTDVKQLVILVKAYWWRTTWFRVTALVILFLLSVFAVIAYMRYRLRREQERAEKQLAIQKERERIIADLHDDVGATLSSIHIYGDLAKKVWDENPEHSKEMVGKISAQSRDLMTKMNDIVWSLQSAEAGKNSFLLKLKNYSQDLLAGKGIASVFNIDQTLDAQISNPLARKNLLLIAKEAINNIAKYSGASKAIITFDQKGGEVQFTIRDNGKGFEKIMDGQGNGLGNIRQRCLQLNGNCHIESEPRKGVTITCRFPLAIISYSG